METQAMENLYQKIANQVNEMIPEDWEKILIYAEVSEGATEVFFYYYPEGKEPVYCFNISNIFEIDEEKFDDMHDELMEYFEQLWEEFKNNKQELWSNLTFILDNEGKFKIDYNYDDLSQAIGYKQQIIWEYKYLGIVPEDKVDKEYLDNYLKRNGN